ncbi:hypothetical protein CSUB01_09079 [Colletotrichum sublineola]|uniref:Uncharacterized protein n=1 Tax=Colletotrichum sublineola TaxID=1173701 RepID=A0A066XQM3_COLSU|nr:hypothetical protein CSUB01_09079 [Colletotrichum sublineola]
MPGGPLKLSFGPALKTPRPRGWPSSAPPSRTGLFLAGTSRRRSTGRKPCSPARRAPLLNAKLRIVPKDELWTATCRNIRFFLVQPSFTTLDAAWQALIPRSPLVAPSNPFLVLSLFLLPLFFVLLFSLLFFLRSRLKNAKPIQTMLVAHPPPQLSRNSPKTQVSPPDLIKPPQLSLSPLSPTTHRASEATLDPSTLSGSGCRLGTCSPDGGEASRSRASPTAYMVAGQLPRCRTPPHPFNHIKPRPTRVPPSTRPSLKTCTRKASDGLVRAKVLSRFGESRRSLDDIGLESVLVHALSGDRLVLVPQFMPYLPSSFWPLFLLVHTPQTFSRFATAMLHSVFVWS